MHALSLSLSLSHDYAAVSSTIIIRIECCVQIVRKDIATVRTQESPGIGLRTGLAIQLSLYLSCVDRRFRHDSSYWRV